MAGPKRVRRDGPDPEPALQPNRAGICSVDHLCHFFASHRVRENRRADRVSVNSLLNTQRKSNSHCPPRGRVTLQEVVPPRWVTAGADVVPSQASTSKTRLAATVTALLWNTHPIRGRDVKNPCSLSPLDHWRRPRPPGAAERRGVGLLFHPPGCAPADESCGQMGSRRALRDTGQMIARDCAP
jgi:hypothetical protein